MTDISKNTQVPQCVQTDVSSSVYDNMLIGKKDSNGIELKNGDIIIIEVCKPDCFNRNGVYHKGEIVFKDCAFSIKRKRNEGTYDITPLCHYVSTCKITLNN